MRLVNDKPTDLSGHYLLKRKGTGGNWLATVVPIEAVEALVPVMRLMAALPKSSPVARPETTRPIHAGAHAIFLTEFVDGRFPEPTCDDVTAIGDGLARLHADLRSTADSATLLANAQARRERLNKSLAKARTAGGHVAAILKHLDVEFDTFAQHPAAGPLHGDANPGNILIIEEAAGPRAVFLDFEDAVHSWDPPVVDLAIAVERLCLTEPADQAIELGTSLLIAYAQAGECAPVAAVGDLLTALKLINLRAILLLLELKSAGAPPSAHEWRKFERNAERLVELGPAIARIEAAVTTAE